jgi:SAM-dependent methyltransferase
MSTAKAFEVRERLVNTFWGAVKNIAMRKKLLAVLVCPKCRIELACTPSEMVDDEIERGSLSCAGCGNQYPIENGIPRFVGRDNYASSFGYQWNRFKSEQIDSINGTRLSEKRFYSETHWTAEWMKGKWILDAGCGAGRFLDIASKAGCEVVGIDISNAVDAARANLTQRSNVHLVQASIYEPPFRSGTFDGCYCIGVVQHTPDPQQTMHTLPRVLRHRGRIAITAYERKPWTMLYTKYWLRPLTTRIDQQKLLAGIKRAMPVLFPLTNVLFRLPLAGRFFMFAIPVANYVHERSMTPEQRYDWAILDTFDMLSPRYDQPRTRQEVEKALSSAGVIHLRRLDNSGLNIIGEKDAEPKIG